MTQILITDPIHQDGIDLLYNENYFVIEAYDYSNDDIYYQINQADALIVRTETDVTERVLNRGSLGKLKVVGRAGVGLDNIDVQAAKIRNIEVFNTPEANTVSAAEHTVGMMLALARHIPQATGGTRQGRWERHRFMGVELNGKKVGIIGVGRVGSHVAHILKAFGMDVYGYDPWIIHTNVVNWWYDDIVDLVKNVDFLTIHVPLYEMTEDYIDKSLIDEMKPGVRIINCARGPLVNQEDLIDALDSGHVSGYACDVFRSEPVGDANHPFYQRRNVICTPHIGAMTEEAQSRVGTEICTQIINFLKGCEDAT
jgi:D-3-phosphoglycerate dehydrogenase / 2-oxoglutarate reductase